MKIFRLVSNDLRFTGRPWLLALALGLSAAPFARPADVPPARGDFWLDGENSFRVAGATAARKGGGGGEIAPDYTRKTTGDASIRFKLTDAAPVVRWVPAFHDHWAFGPGWKVQFDLSAAEAGATGTLVLVDAKKQRVTLGKFAVTAAEAWQHLAMKLAGDPAPAADGFDFDHVSSAELRFEGAAPKTLWLDAVRFVAGDGKTEVALTDLKTTDRIAAEAATRPVRIEQVFAAKISPKAATNLGRLFANLWMNRDLPATNRELVAIYGSKDPKLRADYGLEYTWALQATPMMCRLLLNFGSQSKRMPGRLTLETEKVMLDLLWERTELKNDLQNAKASVWNLTGSENHDLNAKVGNVLVSQLFMHDKAYAGRVLPDLGKGPGSGYWFHKTDDTGRYHGPEGRAVKTLTGEFRAKEHYAAWVAFMKEYLRERARRGFFLEKGSPVYMKYTTSFIQDLYDYCEDEELRKLAGMFLDLEWAEWAQDELRGMRGGGRNREHGVLDFEQDSIFNMASYLFGGPADANPTLISFTVSNYRPPAIVWNLALNRTALGSYAYISHEPGEERSELPRPPGMERTLLCAPDSRLKRYSWVTPDYILGTRMDYPLAVQSHLSDGSCWQGMIFNTSTRALVFPRDIELDDAQKPTMGHESSWRSVQDGPILITQQNRGGVPMVNPDWFPRSDQEVKPCGVYFPSVLDHVEEEAGWIFAQAGQAYVAVHIVSATYADPKRFDWLTYQASANLEEPLDPAPYTWSSDHTIAQAKEKHSSFIFEAGRAADYPTLADFKKHILRTEIHLTKVVVPGYYTLTYISGGKTFYFNAANTEIPQINGEYITFFPPKTFDSPYLSSKYGEGIVTVSDGHDQRVLNFEKVTVRDVKH